MSDASVDLLEGSAGTDPTLDVALAHALLNMVAEGRRGGVLRCYRPGAAVAFGRRDSFLPGFPVAAEAARRHGFTPLIRGTGGRAAAYDGGCLVLDEIMPSADSMAGIRDRFAGEAERQARALRGLGIDARVGQVPGEYCPGEFSVNARGATKLIGAAQRIIRGAWLLSTVVVVRPAGDLRAVLEDVYAALGLDWDPVTAGSIATEPPEVSIEQVRDALLAQYAERYALASATPSRSELARVEELVARHRV